MNIVYGLLGLILAGAGGIIYLLFEVIRQQGRLLLRLDGIEQHLGLRQPAAPASLAVGAVFPSFTLPDLTGKKVALEDFLGQQVLLINWSPQCGYCSKIAPDLVRLQESFQAHHIIVVLAAYGDAEINRKLLETHGLNESVILLLQGDEQTVKAFKNQGTPAAYLINEEGQVSQPFAVGAEQVPKLMRQAVGLLSNDVKAAQAPGFGPGTELKKLLGHIGIYATPNCVCNERALLMDRNGCDWCAQNLDTIVGWLHEEATHRGLPFVNKAAALLVKKSIAKARLAEAKASQSTDDLILLEDQS